MMGFIQVACLLTCSLLPIEDYTLEKHEDYLGVLVWLLTLNSFAVAVSDTIIDGFMVI
jgi:hypothetical protein